MTITLNIQELVENNPTKSLINAKPDSIISKLNEVFTTESQKLFLISFYCYLNYNSRTDFIIDLDDTWKWLGFSKKERRKHYL